MVKSYEQKLQAWAERRAIFYKMHVEDGLSYGEIGALQRPRLRPQTVKILVDKHIKSFDNAKQASS